MKKNYFVFAALITVFLTGVFISRVFAASVNVINPSSEKEKQQKALPLGAFSISLDVKDLSASKAFYEKLGFTAFAGSMQQHYVIMKNGNALIGLFYGMFKGHILTFNPGWDENANNISSFVDVRNIQKQLKDDGVKLTTEADEKTTGPANIILSDPDGNIINIDQHR